MKNKIKKIFFGFEFTDGLLFSIIIYALIISMGFVFVLPILRMTSSSFKDLKDLVDPAIGFLPSKLYLENYQKAMNVLNFKVKIWQSFYIAVLPTIFQTVSAAIIGYGFARYRFPLKNLLLVLTLSTFIVPPQVILLPRYLMFKEVKILGSILSTVLPAAFGQGLRSAIFILIFFQFFGMIPKALEEAAKIDGAKELQIFYGIAIPMATPAIIVTAIFSLVWYWNDVTTTSMFIGGGLSTLPLELNRFAAAFADSYSQVGDSAARLNEGIQMAGTVLTILPMLAVYFVLQRWFVEGVDRSGITGE